jgi:hypothetical protein
MSGAFHTLAIRHRDILKKPIDHTIIYQSIYGP